MLPLTKFECENNLCSHQVWRNSSHGRLTQSLIWFESNVLPIDLEKTWIKLKNHGKNVLKEQFCQ